MMIGKKGPCLFKTHFDKPLLGGNSNCENKITPEGRNTSSREISIIGDAKWLAEIYVHKLFQAFSRSVVKR